MPSLQALQVVSSGTTRLVKRETEAQGLDSIGRSEQLLWIVRLYNNAIRLLDPEMNRLIYQIWPTYHLLQFVQLLSRNKEDCFRTHNPKCTAG